MQNKGIVKTFAVLLTLVCCFYLSFSLGTRSIESAIEKVRVEQGDEAAQHYEDSVMTHKVWLGAYSLKDCREMEIGLGLDLKGGMNVILEVSVPEVVKTLADHKDDAAFNKAVDTAAKESVNSQSDFISLFVKNYKQLAPGAKLAQVFATQQLKGKVTTQSSDSEVESVLREEVKAAVNNSFNVLRTRIDRFGVAQPNIQLLEGQMGRIMVEMPGIKEPERVRKLLQGSANLEFWETYNAQDVLPALSELNKRLAAQGTSSAAKADTTAVAQAANDSVANDTAAAVKADEAKKDVANFLKKDKGNAAGNDKVNAADLEQARKENPLFVYLYPTNGRSGCVVGYAKKRDMEEVNTLLNSPLAKQILPKDLSLKWGVKAIQGTSDIYELYAIRITERNGRAPLEGDVVVEAKDEFDQRSQPCVSMTMNTDGARRWATLTKANVDRCIAIVLDDYVYSAPNVNSEISGGVSQITGNFTIEDTKDLANVLKSGKMPAPARIVQEEIVGPSLGAESIQQGVESFVLAFVLLMIYMCAMYGLVPGMIANGALILNLFFTLGVLTSFQAALTMSGIAGLVLSLGMAVDANVLIYERTKEELKAEKGVKEAIAAGYSNAFSAIFDSNLTSIITGIILFNFGTGPIRGFATTLIIGIVVSFFTAVFLTRIVYEHFLEKGKFGKLTFTTPISKNLMQGTHYNFMGAYKKSFAVFGAFVAVCLASFFVRGLSSSIDFTGGRNFVVQFDNATSPESVRELMTNAFEGSTVNVIALGGEGNTVRISTNYKIDEQGQDVDSEIESKLYEVLQKGNLIDSKVTLKTFIDRDNRAGGSIISSQKVGPSIAKDIVHGAIWSVILALLAIALYIFIRFRSWTFSLGAGAALIVDTILIIGVYSLFWGILPFSLEIDQTFIGAILTAIGYSINDKVVIFDRIREYLGLYPKRDRQKLFNQSLNTTLARTINTSVSTLVVLLCIFIFGGASIRSFAFAMILGVVIGTSTSLFIAAPVSYLAMGKKIEEDENDEK